MSKKISLLIHGNYEREWLEKIVYNVRRSKFDLYEIVVVSYVDDVEKYEKKLAELNISDKFLLCPCKDLINPGFFNINRQIRSVQVGLERLKGDCFVIKLRNDQSINFNKLKKYIDALPDDKILTTNCFTRKDRLYHPSDMMLCASYEMLKEYFSSPLMASTHLSHIMGVQKEFILMNGEMKALKIAPESYLFRNFIEKKAWKIKETEEDSLAALTKYIELLNSWDIDLRWKDKKNPLLPAGSIILPHSFKMTPFERGPIENVRCINRHEIKKKPPTFKDTFFICLSWFCFLGFNENARNNFFRVKRLLPSFVKRFIKILLPKKLIAAICSRFYSKF